MNERRPYSAGLWTPTANALELKFFRTLRGSYALLVPAAPRPGSHPLVWLAEVNQRRGHVAAVLARRIMPLAQAIGTLGAADFVKDMRHEMKRAGLRRPRFARFARDYVDELIGYILKGAEPAHVLAGDAEFWWRHSLDLAGSLEASMADEIRTVVLDGLNRGLTDADIWRDLNRFEAGGGKALSFGAARNWTTYFYNAGSLQMGDEAGDGVQGWRYEVVDDNRTTPICRGYIGVYVAKGTDFKVPPLHYGCRTRLYPEMASRFGGLAVMPTRAPATEPMAGFGANPLLGGLRRAA